MKNRWIVSAPLLLALVVVGCAPGIPSAATGEESSPTRSAQTLVLVARGELASLAAKQLQGTGGGIDQLSSVQLRDPHARVSFSGAFTAGASNLLDHTRDEIPTAEKRWQGKNRGGWEDPEFNRLASLFITTLEPAERTRIIVSVARIFSQELPGIPHYLSTSPVAWTSRLANVPSGTGPGIEPLALIHRWEWR